ncbi:MAG: hypothetical protein OQK71_07020, partial [Desulfobacter sp.]|nr:hypothetical protein [Desulfobacter sp.]
GSYNDSSTNINDITQAVATSELDAAVTYNSLTLREDVEFSTGTNSIGAYALSQAAGITVVSVNSGVQSMVQQSVNVQANVNN